MRTKRVRVSSLSCFPTLATFPNVSKKRLSATLFKDFDVGFELQTSGRAARTLPPPWLLAKLINYPHDIAYSKQTRLALAIYKIIQRLPVLFGIQGLNCAVALDQSSERTYEIFRTRTPPRARIVTDRGDWRNGSRSGLSTVNHGQISKSKLRDNGMHYCWKLSSYVSLQLGHWLGGSGTRMFHRRFPSDYKIP